MCGIISYFSNENKYSLKMENVLRQLISMDSVRGMHSTGLIFEDGGEVDYFKKAVNGHDFVQLKRTSNILKDFEKTRYLIAHNRAATKGAVTAMNAHPFQHGDITGVHNGTLSHGFANLAKGQYPVDSEYVFAGINERGSKKTIKNLNGSFNLLWHDDADNTIHIARNSDRPYVIAKVKGLKTLVGASEEAMLTWILERNGFEIEDTLTPLEGWEYTFDVEDFSKPKMVKRKLYKPAKTYHNQSNYYNPPTNDYNPVTFTLDRFTGYHSNKGARGAFTGKTLDGEDIIINNTLPRDFKVDGTIYIGTPRYTSNIWTAGVQKKEKVLNVNTIKVVKDVPTDKEKVVDIKKSIVATVH